ncbi:MAG: membrane protein insertion efficiency factor YidD [Candidatus Levyibacteriota bacterium]
MTNILISILGGYQKVLSPLLHQILGVKTACRMQPSCSEYARETIGEYGFGKGVVLSLRRLLNCQPFFTI